MTLVSLAQMLPDKESFCSPREARRECSGKACTRGARGFARLSHVGQWAWCGQSGRQPQKSEVRVAKSERIRSERGVWWSSVMHVREQGSTPVLHGPLGTARDSPKSKMWSWTLSYTQSSWN